MAATPSRLCLLTHPSCLTSFRVLCDLPEPHDLTTFLSVRISLGMNSDFMNPQNSVLGLQIEGHFRPFYISFKRHSAASCAFYKLRTLLYSSLALYGVDTAVTLQICIREASNSNCGRITGCPEKGISWFYSVSPTTFRINGIQADEDRVMNSPFMILLPFRSSSRSTVELLQLK
jgi:hypothetical protein